MPMLGRQRLDFRTGPLSLSYHPTAACVFAEPYHLLWLEHLGYGRDPRSYPGLTGGLPHSKCQVSGRS